MSTWAQVFYHGTSGVNFNVELASPFFSYIIIVSLVNPKPTLEYQKM
jgi:hypothetical protein